MKKQILLSLSLVLMSAVFGFAQTTRTVTNADLEKFRQKREKNEAEYRATYKQRGMPSPEELAEREARRQKDLAEYADRARTQEQQQQQYQIQIPLGQTVVQTVYPAESNGQTYYGGQSLGSYFYNGRRYRGSRGNFYNYNNVQPHTQLSPLLPNVQINRNPTRIFTTPNNQPGRIYSSPGRGGGRRN